MARPLSAVPPAIEGIGDIARSPGADDFSFHGAIILAHIHPTVANGELVVGEKLEKRRAQLTN